MERKSSSTPLKDLFSKFGPAKKQETPKPSTKKPIKKLDLKKSAFNKAEEKKTKEAKPKKKVTKDKPEEVPSTTDVQKKPDESAQKPNEKQTDTKNENNDVTELKAQNEVTPTSDNATAESKVEPEPDTKQLEFTIETNSTEEGNVVLEKDTEFNVTVDLGYADKANDKIKTSDVKTVTKTKKIDNSVVAENVPDSNEIQTVDDVESSDSIEELAKEASVTLKESDENVDLSKDEISEKAIPDDNKSPSLEEGGAEPIPQPETSKSDREQEGSTDEKTGCTNEADERTSKPSDSAETEATLVGSIHGKGPNEAEVSEVVEDTLDNETAVNGAEVEESRSEKEHDGTTGEVITESKEPDATCHETLNDATGESAGSVIAKPGPTEGAIEDRSTTDGLNQEKTDGVMTESKQLRSPDKEGIDDSNALIAENTEIVKSVKDDTLELRQEEHNQAYKEPATPSSVKIDDIVPATDETHVEPSVEEETIQAGEIEAEKQVIKDSSPEDVKDVPTTTSQPETMERKDVPTTTSQPETMERKDVPTTTSQPETMERKAGQMVDEAMAAAVQEVVATVTNEANVTSTEEPEVKQVEADEEVTEIMESSHGIVESGQGQKGEEVELTEQAQTQPKETPTPNEKPITTSAKPANMPGESTILFTKTFTESITPNEFIPIEPRGDASLLPVFFTRSEAKKEENAAHPGTTIPHVHAGMTETTKKTVSARQEIYDIRAEMQRLRDMMRALDEPQKFITDY